MAATTDSIENVLKDKLTSFVDDSRGMIALEASYEIDSLTRLMVKILNQHHVDGSDDEFDPIALRGLAMRVKELNSVIMSAVGDYQENNRSLNSRFSGHLYEYMIEYSNGAH